MKKRNFLISLILFFIVLFITISLYISVDNQTISYETINCVVTKVYSKPIRYYGSIYKYNYIFTVEYNGKEYELLNDYDESFRYPIGAKIQAYLSDGKIYANTAGIKTDTGLSTLYFIFIFITQVMLIIVLITWNIYNKEKKATLKTSNERN